MNRILLVYASKTGTTQDTASELEKHLSMRCDLYNCRNELLVRERQTQINVRSDGLNWNTYGMVIIGTAMYMGRPMKEIKHFCKKYQDKLIKKRLALFSCGIGTETEDKEYLWKKLPEVITNNVLLYRHLGGEIREERMNAFARFAMKEYVKQNGPAKGINHVGVKEFCEEIEKLMN
jgi:menaquinone-dependent protoporphyrinogen oxidase